MVGTLATAYILVSVVFLGMALVPGDAAEAGLGASALSPSLMAQRRAALGLDRPLFDQYISYVSGIGQGDFGVSWMSGQPVGLLLSQQFPSTAALAGSALLIAILIGFPLGVMTVYSDNFIISPLVQALVALILSTPVMVSGTVLVLVFAIYLHLLPATGQGTLAHLLLPALAVGLNIAGSFAKAIEAGLAEISRQPFVVLARAKGLTSWQTLWRHALPAGLLPVLEIMVLQIGYLFSGAVITENLFARQGFGRLLVTAILNKDVPVVLGVATISISIYSLLHFVAEIGYVWLDPRIRTAKYA